MGLSHAASFHAFGYGMPIDGFRIKNEDLETHKTRVQTELGSTKRNKWIIIFTGAQDWCNQWQGWSQVFRTNIPVPKVIHVDLRMRKIFNFGRSVVGLMQFLQPRCFD